MEDLPLNRGVESVSATPSRSRDYDVALPPRACRRRQLVFGGSQV